MNIPFTREKFFAVFRDYNEAVWRAQWGPRAHRAGCLFSMTTQNDKYARQIPSSGGIAVFFGQAANHAHWVEAGRSHVCLVLQATALGIRNAFVSQSVEVAAMRPLFSTAQELGLQRNDPVVRFGRRPVMPRSLRRPVETVLV